MATASSSSANPFSALLTDAARETAAYASSLPADGWKLRSSAMELHARLQAASKLPVGAALDGAMRAISRLLIDEFPGPPDNAPASSDVAPSVDRALHEWRQAQRAARRGG